MLVAIAIPVFTSQLERSKESTDAANLRAAYAVAAAAVLEPSNTDTISAGPVTLQNSGNWDHVKGTKIATLTFDESGTEIPTKGPLYVNVTTDGKVTITSSAAGTVVDPVTGATS